MTQALLTLNLTIPLCRTTVPWPPVIVNSKTRTKQHTQTPTHTHFKHWRIKEMDVIDCKPGWNKIHPTFYTDSQSPILNTHTHTRTHTHPSTGEVVSTVRH